MAPPRLPLALEAPVLIRVDGRDLSLLLCTALSLEDLALGHLVGKGLLKDRESLLSLHICEDRSRVDIERAGGPPLPEGDPALIGSACGSGLLPAELFGLVAREPLSPGTDPRATAAHPSTPLFSLRELAARAHEMFAAASMHRDSGGMHCAALASCERDIPTIVREDVGRHNAIDKVLGRGLLEGRDFSRSAILTSGRIAADMVAKAIHAGVPLLASRSIPTTAAFELASTYGLALVGRIASREALIYCGAELLSDG
ncbi:MAG TPA: formate dehydrogenase accessory sulfurtransferase FdhD [Rectinemataceae bacterium]|nr:formate dehydrogenase accessory sulfurtransferase FdhD [Rectinemataceae bacterium]